ncbi:MAG: hypothetical protein ABSG43_19965 [Solirubrobacteraceae bacterium]
MPARELVPVSCVREWLGEHRPGDDDVDRGGVWSDCPVAASTDEDLLELVPDLGPERDDFLVINDRAPVKGEDQIIACRDRPVEELLECRGGGLVAQRGGARMLKDELEGAQRQSR